MSGNSMREVTPEEYSRLMEKYDGSIQHSHPRLNGQYNAKVTILVNDDTRETLGKIDENAASTKYFLAEWFISKYN